MPESGFQVQPSTQLLIYIWCAAAARIWEIQYIFAAGFRAQFCSP